jgi:hypothetical protein
MRCQCGGTFVKSEGLEGSFCNKCGAYSEQEATPTTLDALYSAERIGSVRGIPMNEFTLGSETKGRVKISIPVYATNDEAKAIIDTYIALLRYTKEKVEENNLDIYATRRKKNEDE